MAFKFKSKATADLALPSSGESWLFYNTATSLWSTKDSAGTVAPLGSTAVADGDKGDITVTGSGATWTLDNDVVTNAKLANVSSLTFKGRLTASSGDPEDLTASQARKILDPVTALTNSSGTVTVDCSLGVSFTITLAANVTTLTLSNLQGAGYATEIEIEIKQDATGSRTFALPAAFKALGGSDTAIATAANAVTILSAKTFDNGTTWRYAMQDSA